MLRRCGRWGVDASSTVVDLGAGTGTFAQAIARQVARMIAVDVSRPMVTATRARGVEAVRAGFLSYEHQGASPDAVYTRNALHHLPDFWKVIALSRWLEQAVEDSGRGWTASELAEHVREEYSTSR